MWKNAGRNFAYTTMKSSEPSPSWRPGGALAFPDLSSLERLTPGPELFSFCSMNNRAQDEDGQLHTLGLLERLRDKTRLIQDTYSDLYREVDKLLREIENRKPSTCS
jgi:hypothetical protein